MSISLVQRLRFDATRCEAGYSKGVAGNIEEAADRIERLETALKTVLGDAEYGQKETWTERCRIGREIERDIAKAVAAERERCAKIAETTPTECLHMWNRPGGPPGNGWRKTTGVDIAALIRKG